MAKKINGNEKRNNYQIEKIRTPMSREKLNELYEEFSSDDDYVNYHLELIEDTHRRYLITILNDERKSPIKNSEESRSYGFMKPNDALEFITTYIDEGRTNSKPKAVMQNGYSKRSLDKYNDLVRKESEEGEKVTEFTKPTFDEVMNNIYVNVYNGSTYHEKDEDLPDDLREDVGVIIPGLIESKEEYFEFVKKLKDRGRNGLGRSIYEKYEDYVDALEIIEQYKQALYDKYGGKEEFFYAKEMGGIFGAYEYYPTVKPRFKKTARNIKLDRGINLNELALVKDMGRRIREEYEDEIDQLEVNNDITIYENTPPKFKDLPEDLQIFYKTDKNNINGFTHTDKFTSLEKYANDLIKSSDPDKQIEGYRILEDMKNEVLMNIPMYTSEFVDIADEDSLSLNALLSQYEYDKMCQESNFNMEYVDSNADSLEIEKAFRKYMEIQLCELNGLDIESADDRKKVKEMVEYSTKYVFDEGFRRKEDEINKVNSAGDVLYRNNTEIVASFGREEKATIKNGESKLQKYVRELSRNAKESLERMYSNADNVNKTRNSYDESSVSINEITGDSTVNMAVDGFELTPNPSELLKYMKNNETLAKKIFEISSDRTVNDMFSERTNIDDFIEEAKVASKPMITKYMIDKSLKSNRKGE
jgi:hypothetical protein